MRTEDKGKVFASKECQAAVTGVTGITMPGEYPKLADDWSRLLKNPKSMSYRTLRTDLDALAARIDENNKNRDFVNRDFHPDVCALSVFS